MRQNANKSAFVEKIDQIFTTLKMRRAILKTITQKTNFQNLIFDQFFRTLFYLLIKNEIAFFEKFQCIYISKKISFA